ncbi:acylneuraminate cytidylyltransferase family protein [Pelagibacterales bacterium SAG-MED33]|nr:acylneuraminate cytidylyltransferase family protein [Pelagibacterales bacterium SAG-MED33]
MNIVAIIPARKGSKSVRNKNIAIYKNRPLIYHSIKTALDIELIDRIIVSTNSEKYRKIAKSYGAEAPFLRPEYISKNTSLDRDFLKHAYNFLKLKEDYKTDLFILLRPTTPNRKKNVLINGIKFFLKNIHKADSMRSLSLFNQPAEKFFYKQGMFLKGYFDKTLKGEYHSLPRQKFNKTYLPNGYIDILKPNYFLNKKKRLFGKKILAYITEETTDIDTKNDFLK